MRKNTYEFEKQTQIKVEDWVEVFIFNEVSTIVSAKYFNYNNIFPVKYATELLKNIKINEYTIKLDKNKQLFFRSIHNLKPIELEILKTYILTNLVSSFIQSSKSSVRASILFNKKPDKSFCFCVNYQDLHNQLIKNRYLLPLICESLN